MGEGSLIDWMPVLLAGFAAIAVVAVAGFTLATVALVRTRRPRRRTADGGAAVPAVRQARREFANLLLRYSEELGVELVTGRVPVRDGGSIALRVQLEHAVGRIREPGAVELLDEVGDAREGLEALAPRRRAAANGITAMEVEWAIERWVADPRGWLADLRERERLRRIAGLERLPEAS